MAFLPRNPVLSIIFLSIGTLGTIGSMPLFWPMPSAFLTGTAAAAGIGVINSIGNLGGYIGPNVPVWAKPLSRTRQQPLYLNRRSFADRRRHHPILHSEERERPNGKEAAGCPNSASLKRSFRPALSRVDPYKMIDCRGL